jgi:hypothetical protein
MTLNRLKTARAQWRRYYDMLFESSVLIIAREFSDQLSNCQF